MTAKFKIGDTLMIKTSKSLEAARYGFVDYFPKFVGQPIFVGHLDLQVMFLRPLTVKEISFSSNLNKYVYHLSFTAQEQDLSCHKLEDFLTEYINYAADNIESLIQSEVYTINNEKYEQELLSDDFITRYKAASRLKNYQPTSAKFGIPYYIAKGEFDKLKQFGNQVIEELFTYLLVCSDDNSIHKIFKLFREFGETSIGPLLHLFTIPNYEFRYKAYEILGEIGNRQCIDYFELMRQNETKYQFELESNLLKLKNKYQ